MLAKVATYRLSPRARQDMEAIWLYSFNRWSLRQADDYYAELVSSFAQLASGMKRGRNIGHGAPGHLALASGSHFIIYRQTPSMITIIRILHQRMNITAHLR